MMVNRFTGILLALALGLTVSSFGQDATDRKLFERTKSQADKGDAEAQMNLASLYLTGTGVRADPVKAFKWHRKAAEQGLARAEYQVGLDYAQGAGVKTDKGEAVRWFQRAADQNLAEAQLMLGLCYANGDGVRENSARAVGWFRKAVDQGLAEAKYELGTCYLQGRGVTKDLVEAIRWIEEAAQDGFPPAQNTLGQCYEKGNGLPKDPVQAYLWFSLAAAQDDEHAADIRVSLAKLESALTPEQIASAQQLARKFKPGPAIQPGQRELQARQDQAVAEGARTGAVQVTAADELSEVYVDGTFVGNPPTKLMLSEGTHVITVKKAGCSEYRRELKVTPGSELTLRAILEKQ